MDYFDLVNGLQQAVDDQIITQEEADYLFRKNSKDAEYEEKERKA